MILTLETTFGPSLTVQPSSLVTVPQLAARSDNPYHTAPGTALLAVAPDSMLAASRRNGGARTRVGRLSSDDWDLGMFMALSDGDFVAIAFDVNDAGNRDVTEQAMAQRCVRAVLQSAEDRMLIAHDLDSESVRHFARTQDKPMSPEQLMVALLSVTDLFRHAEAFLNMSIDPAALQSVYVSICHPQTPAYAGSVH